MTVELPPPDAFRHIFYQCVQSVYASGFDESYTTRLRDSSQRVVDTKLNSDKIYDAIILNLDPEAEIAQQQIREAIKCLGQFGYIYLFYASRECLDPCLAECELTVYAAWQCSGHGLIFQSCDVIAEDNGLVMAVSAAYNPVDHVRSLYTLNDKMSWAYEVLLNLPDEKLSTLAMRGDVATERLYCLLQYDKDKEASSRLNRVARHFRV